jgi:hypothetical protein
MGRATRGRDVDGYPIIATGLISLCVGFLAGRLWGHRWKREADYLKKQLDETERLLDGLAWIGGSHRPEPQVTAQENPPGPQPATRAELENTQNVGVTQPPETPSPAKRRVRVTRILGKKDGVQRNESFEGLEEALPMVGKRYCVSTDHDTVIRSSTVIQVASGYFMTRNSVYRVDPL